ncbi:AAA family ATPase [Oceanimonas pelagia]|uniref:AAA family ATPase n=1 Tax=Oceanimonas pelagia TaxID=3028314 RepID=A0AA50KLD2_9GAMM|nr:AAA family ATPase [Oceanimonas pelagia]WMC09574.1 AAA family ATPase [Oceanimonas pelagia]
MIKQLTYDVTFSNGKQLKRELTLDAGSWLITGKNEAGKSMNLEMIAYTLYGTEALRGKSGDYTKIKSRLELSIRGQDYVIERTKSNGKVLAANGDVLAEGTKGVNAKVTELMGYDLSVFRIAHWCAQGDIQALANMKPTERKAMVDNVSGLNQLDALELFLKETIKTYKDQLSAIEGVVHKPEAPEKPEGLSRADLENKMKQLQDQFAKVNRLKAVAEQTIHIPEQPTPFTSRPMPERPLPYQEQALPAEPEYQAEPEQPVFPGSEDEPEGFSRPALEQLKENQKWREQLLGRIERLKAELLDIGSIDPDKVDQLRTLLATAEQSKEKARLQAMGEVDCPNCNHHFPLEHQALAELADVPDNFTVQFTARDIARFEAQLEQKQKLENTIENAYNELEMYPDAASTIAEWEAYDQALQKWNLSLMHWEQACAQVKELNAQARDHWKNQCKRVVQANQAGAEHYAQQMVKWDQLCTQTQQENAAGEDRYQKALEHYQRELVRAQEAQEARRAAQEELQQLPDEAELHNAIEEVRAVERRWEVYDFAMEQYTTALKKYEQHQAEIERMRVQLKDHQAAQAGIKAVKARVKNYLLPSLNQAASYLVNEMTGGERAQVVIDESFEVEVDGQPLRTLSGSGQDITNLAIRLGLGQILTHKVLPLFMVDEHDAGMDWERATYTHNCLTKITPKIGQLLIVSHKELSAENIINI